MAHVDAPSDEADLAALLARIFPQLAALEEPILAAAGLSMWEYTIATELSSATVVSQTDLARRTGRDPTRLGRHLDDLTERGLVTRTQASDRRQRSATLTPDGLDLHRTVKAQIRRVEETFLRSRLSAAEAARFRRTLEMLAAE